MTRSTRAGLLAAGGLAAALVAGALGSPAGAGDPLPPVADPTGPGSFCEGAPHQHPFGDLDAESEPTREVIVCLVAAGITQGTTPSTYSPGGLVSRRQMAVFIKRLADLLDELELAPLQELPPYDGVPDYPDITPEDPAVQEAVGQLSQALIVGGFPDGTYRPGAPVSRRQMAAFVNRLHDHLTGAPFAPTGDYFDDDDGDPGEGNLDALAGAGIFQGDGQGNVFPEAPITRRQMANILLRHAQVLHDDAAVTGPFTAP